MESKACVSLENGIYCRKIIWTNKTEEIGLTPYLNFQQNVKSRRGRRRVIVKAIGSQ